MSYSNSTYIGIRKQVTQHLYKFFSQIPEKVILNNSETSFLMSIAEEIRKSETINI
jgi:hypothetical protein